jgi:hypothetical protein
MQLYSALDLRVPRNLTGLLQHLQRLVGPGEHHHWCGGTIVLAKLPGFVHKMELRYTILRNTRARSYDRLRGRAVVHLVVYPTGAQVPLHHHSPISWWLVSSTGTGGLADPSTPDAHVAQDAMDAHAHITIGDYVLLYATKKEPRSIYDAHTGRQRRVLKNISTWTWKLRSEVVREVRALIDESCAKLDIGVEPRLGHEGSGLRGILAAQRTRPLFSGVRNQVLDLHRYARDAWETRRAACCPEAGELLPIAEILAHRLPKMIRLPVYDSPPCHVRDLLSDLTSR